MGPQQEIFTLCLLKSKELFKNVYDYIPGPKTEYPFVFVGAQHSRDKPNKSSIFCDVDQEIHFYQNNMKKRGDMTGMMTKLIYELRKIKYTKNYNIRIKDSTQRVIFDTSTDTPLLHGVLYITFSTNYKN